MILENKGQVVKTCYVQTPLTGISIDKLILDRTDYATLMSLGPEQLMHWVHVTSMRFGL